MLRGMLKGQFVQWLLMVVAIMGGIIMIKMLLSLLPDDGIPGAIKTVGQAA